MFCLLSWLGKVEKKKILKLKQQENQDYRANDVVFSPLNHQTKGSGSGGLATYGKYKRAK